MKDVPPMTLTVVNLADTEQVAKHFPIKIANTHFRIPVGGYSLPLLIELNTHTPSSSLVISASIIDLPENGIVIHKGSKMSFSNNQTSSYLQFRSENTISTIGSKGVATLRLSGDNAASFFLATNIITFEIVAVEDTNSLSLSTIN